ncbi:hypothetical protein PR048_014655 [Dryococelus australis]|uniref:Uncharacterized protein n=1 Tax=Dryococelus australis TaxID=614101 RepID=A0ABQ9HET4_9NEOP|nr:hypothetical protein PR048_014655 [Dryococelus australis]
MERRWNVRAGEAGVPRENPQASGIVQQDSGVRGSGSGPAGDRGSSPDLLDARRARCPLRQAAHTERKQVMLLDELNDDFASFSHADSTPPLNQRSEFYWLTVFGARPRGRRSDFMVPQSTLCKSRNSKESSVEKAATAPLVSLPGRECCYCKQLLATRAMNNKRKRWSVEGRAEWKGVGEREGRLQPFKTARGIVRRGAPWPGVGEAYRLAGRERPGLRSKAPLKNWTARPPGIRPSFINPLLLRLPHPPPRSRRGDITACFASRRKTLFQARVPLLVLRRRLHDASTPNGSSKQKRNDDETPFTDPFLVAIGFNMHTRSSSLPQSLLHCDGNGLSRLVHCFLVFGALFSHLDFTVPGAVFHRSGKGDIAVCFEYAIAATCKALIWHDVFSSTYGDMEQRRNATAREKGYARENTLTSGIVWRDSHMRKFRERTRAGIDTGGILLRLRANTLRLQGKKIMHSDVHRGKEGLGSHGLHFGAMATSLSVLRASLNYGERGKNRQEKHIAANCLGNVVFALTCCKDGSCLAADWWIKRRVASSGVRRTSFLVHMPVFRVSYHVPRYFRPGVWINRDARQQRDDGNPCRTHVVTTQRFNVAFRSTRLNQADETLVNFQGLLLGDDPGFAGGEPRSMPPTMQRSAQKACEILSLQVILQHYQPADVLISAVCVCSSVANTKKAKNETRNSSVSKSKAARHAMSARYGNLVLYWLNSKCRFHGEAFSEILRYLLSAASTPQDSNFAVRSGLPLWLPTLVDAASPNADLGHEAFPAPQDINDFAANVTSKHQMDLTTDLNTCHVCVYLPVSASSAASERIITTPAWSGHQPDYIEGKRLTVTVMGEDKARDNMTPAIVSSTSGRQGADAGYGAVPVKGVAHEIASCYESGEQLQRYGVRPSSSRNISITVFVPYHSHTTLWC